MYHNIQPCISIHIKRCVPVSQDATQYLKIYHKTYPFITRFDPVSEDISQCVSLYSKV